MSSPTSLHLPPTLPFPIKIASLDIHPPSQVSRGTRLLTYSFAYVPPSPNSALETRFGTWDSSIEGTLQGWKVKVGDVIPERKARDRGVVEILEPCTHGVQIGGLCGLCGKDMTDYDYTGFSDTSRASIQMTHSAFGPTVSLEEAQRLERATADHLLKSRKLSLIVDLDQTIVHATVDPTVAEWITEGEVWEERKARREKKEEREKEKKKREDEKDDDDGSDDETSSDEDETESEGEDECNPNWEALKDVKKFRLGPESFGAAPSSRVSKGKQKVIENEGVMYYIKPRPGWKSFLQATSLKYEMHVYTMGTRAYAEEVCAAIDPDGKIFGGRLLSRDESGSLTQKSLQRLFPCDTSMVVIIDDRADVWEWSPNLVKVVPYDFFVGIGDINSTFLPKVDPITAGPPLPVAGSTMSTTTSTTPSSSPLVSDLSKSSGSTSPPSTSTPEDQEAERERGAQETKQMVVANSLVLEAQLEERPLAKQQEALLEIGSESEKLTGASTGDDQEKKKENTEEKLAHGEKAVRKALLKNDDVELQRVSKILEEVHARFFSAYNSVRSTTDGVQKRRLGSSVSRSKEAKHYDVTHIIPHMRSNTLKDTHILFSSVIPLDTRPESTEIWRVAHMFGAKCYTELSSIVTHVVAAKTGTVKVDAARKRGGIKIVWLSWFTDSVALWQRQDETPYLLDDPSLSVPQQTSSSPILDSNQISSDPEPDNDDWDEDGKKKDGEGIDLNAVDWNDVNDEVDAAMNESDDDDDGDARSDKSGIRSGNVSDEESSWTDGSQSAISVDQPSPRLKRKRLRSLTPSEVGINGNKDSLRSPLAKRKKLAAERTGSSRLKDSILAGDLPPGKVASTWDVKEELREQEEDASGDDNDEEEEEEGAFDDDFLAGALEEDWG